MTYQPPPPPPGPPPPTPNGRACFDAGAVDPLDWGIIGAGLVVFLLSFNAFYDGATVTAGGRSVHVDGTASAWNDVVGGGFFGWFAMVFAVAGAVFVALELFAPQIRPPVGKRVVGLGLFALAALFEIIAIFVTPGASDSGFGQTVTASLGHGFGFWASLLVIIAGTVMSLMRLQATGGQLPGGLNDRLPSIGGYGPPSGIGRPSGPRPAPGPGLSRDQQPPPPGT